MVLKSDILVARERINPKNIPSSVDEFYKSDKSDGFVCLFKNGIEKSRENQLAGESGWPKPIKLPSAINFEIPSRESGRSIPCRAIKPDAGRPVRGVFMHFHGGGFICGSHELMDPILKQFTDGADLVTVSVGYRLSPEHPYPAAVEDAIDAMEWLIDNAEKTFGGPLSFIGGDSAGAYLSMMCGLHLISHPDAKYSKFPLKGLLIYYGCMDMSLLPSFYINNNDFSFDTCKRCIDLFVPDETKRKDPAVSPLYFDFGKLPADVRLPPAMFLCGTRDFFVDDTMLMYTRWLTAGGEAYLHLVPGAYHAFYELPLDAFEGLQEARDVADEFMRSKLD